MIVVELVFGNFAGVFFVYIALFIVQTDSGKQDESVRIDKAFDLRRTDGFVVEDEYNAVVESLFGKRRIDLVEQDDIPVGRQLLLTFFTFAVVVD